MLKHYIIPVFIPHYGCQYQCVFCNQRKITGVVTTVNAKDVERIIETHLARISQPRYIEVAFFGGSFTALPVSIQQLLLDPAFQAYQAGRIHGIRLSTRPDAISDEIADLLLRYNVSTVELGVQSLDDTVLAASNRGHSVYQVKQAAEILTAYNFLFGIQLMPGLPQEDWHSLLLTATRVLQLKPHFARIYPTIVIQETVLAEMYRHGAYQPLCLEEAIKRAAFLKRYFERSNIPVIRTGLQATEELDKGDTVLAGPYHPAFGELVDGYIFLQMILQALAAVPYQASTTLICHSRDESKIRGPANSNLRRLSEKTQRQIILKANGERQGEVMILQQGYLYTINRNMIFSN